MADTRGLAKPKKRYSLRKLAHITGVSKNTTSQPSYVSGFVRLSLRSNSYRYLKDANYYTKFEFLKEY